MPSKKKHTGWVVWLRRAIQTFFLLIFLHLFLETTYHPINQVGGPVEIFFQIDPLVAIGTFLAEHAIPAILLISLVTLGVTVIFGRWFCGWICPFGVLHNFFTGMRRRRMKDLMQQGTYTSGQKIKYYILVGVLISALLGVNAVGWLDPFSFFYRSLATSVYPAVNWGLEHFFTWIYQTDPHIGALHLTSITEPIYEKLRDFFLQNKQPVYYGGTLIGLLFVLVVGLNFYKGRFWCRYLCPLGALLGVAGKNPMFRLVKRMEDCHNCRVCLADCQGGAEPQTHNEWKPSECFYCWNCSDACATNAISFQFEFPKAAVSPSHAIIVNAAPKTVVAPAVVEEAKAPPAPAVETAPPKTAPKTNAKTSSKSTPKSGDKSGSKPGAKHQHGRKRK